MNQEYSTDKNSESKVNLKDVTKDGLIEFTPDSLPKKFDVYTLDEEIPDNTEYTWTSIGNYRPYKEFKTPRDIGDIASINKITRYYTKYLIEQKHDPSNMPDFKCLSSILKHRKLFDDDLFLWEEVEEDLADMVYFTSNFSCLTSYFDSELLDHSLFQKLFPIEIIVDYMYKVNRSYGLSIYDQVLRFQTNLAKVLMYHHLAADTRFHSRISSIDINFIDPFLRIKIRENNRKDARLLQKYFNIRFDLKKFAFKLLDLYFPNVTWRYIGGGQEMHKYSLLLILQIFELGLFTCEEMQDFVNLLLQKLENLLVLEKASYKDFTGNLVGFESFIADLKAYFYECKEIVAAICIQVTILLNDQAFMDSYPLFTKELAVTEVPNKTKAWTSAYFSNSTVGNILNRIMTSYLFRFREKIEKGFNSKLFNLINDFVMLTMDIENDVFFVSSKVVNQSLIAFYFEVPGQADLEEAHRLKIELQNLVDMVAFKNLNKKKEMTEYHVLETMKSFLVSVKKYPEGSQRTHFKHLLGIEGVPNIILALLCSLIHMEARKEIEVICGLALTETCNHSIINQVFSMNEQSMQHWDFIFAKRKLTAVILQTSLFEGNYHLFYVHRSIMRKFLSYFKHSIDSKWELRNQGCTTHLEWFGMFKESVLNDHEDFELDNIIRFYVNCRFLYDLMNDTDYNYESKFHNVGIQSLVTPPLFGLFIKVIHDKEFLPHTKDSAGKLTYNFKPILFGASTSYLNEFIDRRSTHNINESELRCAVFEVAMLTMKLLNKACTGLYSYWLYKHHAMLYARDILNDTRHLLEIPGEGLEWRRVIMHFYTNFRIFPNNSVLTNRSEEFCVDGSSVESRVNLDHLDGTVVSEIINELQLTSEIEKVWDTDKPEHKKSVTQYYLKGLLTLISKYFRGIYVIYCKDRYLGELNMSLIRLKEELMKITPIIQDKFKIQFSVSGDFSIKSEDSPGQINQVLPLAKQPFQRTRILDQEEKNSPSLTSVRDICEQVIGGIDHALMNSEDDYYKMKVLMDQKYYRKSTIYVTDLNKEPWNERISMVSSSTFQAKSANKRSTKNAMLLMGQLMNLTGLNSSEHRYFVDLMDIYQERKSFYLNKPVDQNIFLNFLQSSPGYANNFVTFIVRLVQKYFDHIINKESFDNDIQKSEFLDLAVSIFLQKEIIISIVTFFSKVLADCNTIRDGLYKILTDPSPAGKEIVGASESMISLFYFIMCALQEIVVNKTFMDSEHELIVYRYEQLTEFFKNLCENNCQKFKVYLGKFVPKIKGLPSQNVDEADLVYSTYFRLDSIMSNTEIWKNDYHSLQMKDRPEAFDALHSMTRFLTECINGPCPFNQNRIYMYRADVIVGTLKRQTNNVDSSIYYLRRQICEYVDGLIEGNDPDIVKHFASNFTFTEIFEIICNSIKRLYIYCMINGDLKKYHKIASAAKVLHRAKKLEKKAKEREIEEFMEKEMEFYNKKPEESSVKKVEQIRINTDSGKQPPKANYFTDPKIITQHIMDYVTINDYDEILEMYLRNEEFSNHIILQIVLKLNEFMMRFADSVAGFKICLHNVFGQMVDRYGAEVPIHIINKLGSYERKEEFVHSEKIVLYMFLCKITSEIEVLNPNTKKVTTLLFPLTPKTFFFTKSTKMQFLHSANCDSMTMDMVLNYDAFEIEMEDNLNTYRNYSWLYILTSEDVFYMIKYLLWMISLALNLILIIFYRRDTHNSSISTEGLITLYTLAGFIILLSFGFLWVWFFSRYSQKLKIAKSKWKEFKTLKTSRLTKWYHLYISETIIDQVYPVYFSFYIINCLLGIFLHPFFFSVLLLTIVVLSTTLNYVVKAITTHFHQLILTVFMMVLVMYCYAVLSAEFFFDKFTSNQPGAIYYNCTHMWECVLYVFNYGLRSGGGISDVSIPIDPMQQSGGPYVAKFFYDVIFFMLINVISLNIIFGIIIDTFAELRESNDKQEEALASSCMVCSREKTLLMKEGKDFKQHIQHDHDFWKYVKFLAYLKGKEKEDLNGFENTIWANFSAKLIDWIPARDAEAEENKLDEGTELKTEGEKLADEAEKKQAEEDKVAKTEVPQGISNDQMKEIKEAIESVKLRLEDITSKLGSLETAISASKPTEYHDLA